MPRDPVFERFDRAFAEAYAFYQADDFEKAYEAADNLLCEHNLPRYHHIKCYILVAAAVADEEEADEQLHRADISLSVARAWLDQQSEHDQALEDALSELCEAIDSYRQDFRGERGQPEPTEEEEARRRQGL